MELVKKAIKSSSSGGTGIVARMKRQTSALPLYSILDAADAVPEARLCGAQALVRCAQVLEFLGEPLLQCGELLRGQGVEVDGVLR